ncbi:MAG: 50S ribosomal protein L15 [Nitrospiraceae bacterium]|nr:50S ribosomal protein L15 [Nitrospiraceae bacterium]
MRICDIKPSAGSNKKTKRVGRGIGSGHGKTSCKGHKGQKARSGGTKGAGFEGGQMPLQRRLPKRGFTSLSGKEYSIVNLRDLMKIKGVDVITPEVLIKKGIIKNIKDGIKILGTGEITKPLTIKANVFSASASAKITAAGGKAELLGNAKSKSKGKS